MPPDRTVPLTPGLVGVLWNPQRARLRWAALDKSSRRAHPSTTRLGAVHETASGSVMRCGWPHGHHAR